MNLDFIDVGDGLPELGEHVLVNIETEDNRYFSPCQAYIRIKPLNGKSEWVIIPQDFLYVKYKVSSWAHLPRRLTKKDIEFAFEYRFENGGWPPGSPINKTNYKKFLRVNDEL